MYQKPKLAAYVSRYEGDLQNKITDQVGYRIGGGLSPAPKISVRPWSNINDTTPAGQAFGLDSI
jgi:hypothetical protein